MNKNKSTRTKESQVYGVIYVHVGGEGINRFNFIAQPDILQTNGQNSREVERTARH